MNSYKKLQLLDKLTMRAIKSFTTTITQLEQVNEEYVKEKELVDKQRCELALVADNINNSIRENEKLLNNFKNLLK